MKSHQGQGLAGGHQPQAKPQGVLEVPIAHPLPRPRAHRQQIYTSYKSMRHRGCAHASDKLQWGREPGLLGRPAIPLGHPPTRPSRTPSPSQVGLAAAAPQPGLSAQATPGWEGCRRPAGPARLCRGLPAARPPAGLHRPTLLLAGPKAGSGVLGGERGSAALQGFAFLRHLVGVWELSFSSLSLRGDECM